MKFKSEFLNEIKERGFIYQDIEISELDNLMSKNKISGYIGFDITSDSLHVGSLIQLMLLHWLDFYGHQSIALIGGGTTLIGDPSGKDQTRKILTLICPTFTIIICHFYFMICIQQNKYNIKHGRERK